MDPEKIEIIIRIILCFGLASVIVGLPTRSIAKKKRRSTKGWAIGSIYWAGSMFSGGHNEPYLIICAFVPTLILLVLPETTAGLVRCPHCAEHIQPQAKVCKHCGRDQIGKTAA